MANGMRWVRLALLCVTATLCGGMLPAAPTLAQLFVDAGIYASACQADSAKEDVGSTALPCNAQFNSVSASFQIGMCMSVFGFLPMGIMFDRYGGKTCSLAGASVTVLGLALLQISLRGASAGPEQDAATAVFLPIALTVIDAGALMNSMAIYSILWHFPYQQTFVAAMAGSTYQLSCLLPYLITWIMQTTAGSLSSAMLVYTAMVVMAGIGSFFCAASQAEYRMEAKKALGMPLPKPQGLHSLCKQLKGANDVLRTHWRDHVWLVLTCATAFNIFQLYATRLSNYSKELFSDAATADALPQAYILINAILGISVLPVFTIFADSWGGALVTCFVTLSVASCLTMACISNATWNSQVITCVCSAFFNCLWNVVMQKYVVSYCMPTQFGTTQGVLIVYMVLTYCFAATASYLWIGDGTLLLPFQVLSVLSAVPMICFTIRFILVGVPKVPVLLPSDEVELAEPFGCKNLDELVYVTHLESREQLLEILSSTDPKDAAALLQRIDYQRMEEKVAAFKDQSDKSLIHIEKPVLSTSLASLETKTPSSSNASPMRHDETSGMGVDENAYHFSSVAEVTEVTCVAVTCESEAGSTRFAVTGSPWSAVFGCCHAGPLPPYREPLLGSKQRESAPKQDVLAEKAKAVNDRLLAAVRAGDKLAILDVYRREEVDMLWRAYQELSDRLDQAEMEEFEDQWEKTLPDEEFEELIKQRSALKVLVMKMMALRTKKRLLG